MIYIVKNFLFFIGNFICDIMRAATQTDIALLNSGSLRSDTVHPAGPFKMKVTCVKRSFFENNRFRFLWAHTKIKL